MLGDQLDQHGVHQIAQIIRIGRTVRERPSEENQAGTRGLPRAIDPGRNQPGKGDEPVRDYLFRPRLPGTQTHPRHHVHGQVEVYESGVPVLIDLGKSLE